MIHWGMIEVMIMGRLDRKLGPGCACSTREYHQYNQNTSLLSFGDDEKEWQAAEVLAAEMVQEARLRRKEGRYGGGGGDPKDIRAR